MRRTGSRVPRGCFTGPRFPFFGRQLDERNFGLEEENENEKTVPKVSFPRRRSSLVADFIGGTFCLRLRNHD